MAVKKLPKVSKKSKNLLHWFRRAAEAWRITGGQQAHIEYSDAYYAIMTHIHKLEQKKAATHDPV